MAGEGAAAWEEIRSIFQESNRINHRAILAMHQAREWLVGFHNDSQTGQSVHDLFKESKFFGDSIAHYPASAAPVNASYRSPIPKVIHPRFWAG